MYYFFQSFNQQEVNKILMLTFVIETVDAVDARTFVVSSEEEEVLRIFDFIGKEQAYGLKRLLPSVDIVTKKQIIGIWWEPSILE